jgi:hypothetical protein
VTRGRVAASLALVLACSAQAPPPAAPSGEQILGSAKTAFRAHVRPAYVVYTLVRRDEAHGLPDLENSYALKIWCRTADRAALTRRLWHDAPYGGMDFITVAFDGLVDPGPPTADVFERALYGAPASPLPAESVAPLPIIGSVRVQRDFDYAVRGVRREGDDWHLSLEPKRDPLRNRIDDLWVDAATYEVRRMRVRDHLYLGLSGQSLDDEFDVRFVMRDGLPVISTIDGATAGDAYRTRYTYRIEDFPVSLPPWYFEPRAYRAHRGEAPQ